LFGICSGNHGGGGGRFVLPVGRKLTGGAVVSGKTVDTRFNQNKTEFGILVLSVTFQMLTDLNGLLNKHVKIFWDFRGKSIGLQQTDNLLSSDRFDLSNTIGVTKDDTNLRWSQTLLSKLAYMFFHIRSRNLQPRWRRTLVRECALGDTLSWTMQTTHTNITKTQQSSIHTTVVEKSTKKQTKKKAQK